jgi:hypothetical protein
LAAIFLFARCISIGPSGGGCGYQDDFNDEICGDAVYDGSYDIASQADLDQLSGYTYVRGTLNIENTALTSLMGLEDLVCVRGNLTVADNGALTSLGALQSLVQVGWGLHIENNDSLTSLEGLSNLALVDEVHIEENDSLQSLHGLSGLSSVLELHVINNGLIESLEGPNSLTSIHFMLEIRQNASLTTLEGLESLANLPAGELSIARNPELLSLNGLSSLYWVQRLTITENDSLTSLEGLDSLSDVTSYFWIFDNSSLINLDGLAGLDNVGGAFWIRDNPSLTSMAGISPSLSLGSLWIESNESLNNLDALASPTLENSLSVCQNTDLPTCAATDFRDALQADGWDGEVCIHSNLADTCEDDVSGCYESD